MKAEIDMSDAMKGVTMKVSLRGVRGYRARFWIGQQLIRLAAFVLGCNVQVDGLEIEGRKR